MNRFTTFAAAAATLLTFSATAADAAVYLGFEQDGGGIVTVDTDSAIVAFAGAFGNFEVNVFSGTDGVYPQLLGTSGHARNTSGGNAGTLDVYVTVDDLTGPAPSFFSSFASNVLPTGWTLRLRTYVDDANGTYGGTLLSDNTFGTIGTFTEDVVGPALSGTYSVTARYTITAPTHGEMLSNISLAAVPEPGTWALMIMGFGGAGAMLRSRRKAMVAA